MKHILTLTSILTATFSLFAMAENKTDSVSKAAILNDLHHANQTEIQAGRIAIKKGKSKDARIFGQHLIDDHSAADKKVMTTARREGIRVTTKPASADEREMQQKLQSLEGSQFDQGFAQAMTEDHTKDIQKLETAQNQLEPSPTKSLINSLLPTLRHHKTMAVDLASKLESSARTPANE